ncbi:sensor histidine kinase [Aquimarina agarivorans]|uniref:sensor histidine kinase n=1 Tax=Aquimarina agarivorans TaxID=980584 RepID=UPI0002F5C835|nr:ATP-binding protein [Aquimarina agarivorans]
MLEQRKIYEKGREEAQLKISRELHDGILGQIFGVRLSLDSLNKNISEEGIKKREKYINEIQVIAEEIRQISHKLNKTHSIKVNFQSVINGLIEMNNNSNIKFILEMDASIKWEKISEKIKYNLYRILQEALTNVQKHSRAIECKVKLEIDNPKKLTAHIMDNGVGILKKEIKGIGLKNIRFRVKDLNGKIDFNNNIEKYKGLNITLQIPIN